MIFRKPSTKYSRIKGFTLIEVMISLVIMAMIMTVAFTGLSIGLDSWRRGVKKIDNMDGRATVERILKRQLALANPTEVHAEFQEKPFVLFRGKKDQLDFVADYSLTDGPADFRRIAYRFDGASFRYEEKSLFGYVLSEDERIPGEKLAEFRSFRFRFLTENESHEKTWVDEWPYGKGLPPAVEVHIDGDVIVIPLVNRS